MSESNNIKNKKTKEQLKYERTIKIIKITLSVLFVLMTLIFYFDFYKPQEKEMIRKSRIAFSKIQKESLDMLKEKEKLFEIKEEKEDSFCLLLKEKIGTKDGSCELTTTKKNFNIKGTNIAVFDLQKPAKKMRDTYVKEFYIDINDFFGKNQVGIDQMPLQIFSSGIMGGRLAPVNCNKEHYQKYDFEYSSYCPLGLDVDYLTEVYPFSFDVSYLNSETGKNTFLNTNVSFARADCAATGGELLASEYCDEMGLSWISRCEDDICSVQLSK